MDGKSEGIVSVKAEILVIDPPWKYNDRGEFRKDSKGKCTFGLGAAGRYDTASVEEIASWPIGELGAERSLCFCWITGPFLLAGAGDIVLRAWDYWPATVFVVWIKMNSARWESSRQAVQESFSQPSLLPGYDPLPWLLEEQTMDDLTAPGPGHYSFSNAEYLLVGRRGKKLERAVSSITGKRRVPKQIVFAPLGDHSAKPQRAYDRIEYAWPSEMYPNRIDVFGRVGRSGYLVIGNEAPGCEGGKGEDIRVTIARLLREWEEEHG